MKCQNEIMVKESKSAIEFWLSWAVIPSAIIGYCLRAYSLLNIHPRVHVIWNVKQEKDAIRTTYLNAGHMRSRLPRATKKPDKINKQLTNHGRVNSRREKTTNICQTNFVWAWARTLAAVTPGSTSLRPPMSFIYKFLLWIRQPGMSSTRQ